MAKRTIAVHTPFTIQLDDGSKVRYPVGVHGVTDEVADHWYAQHFIGEKKESAEEAQASAPLVIKPVLPVSAQRLQEKRDAANKVKEDAKKQA